jgi:hypothetical protein
VGEGVESRGKEPNDEGRKWRCKMKQCGTEWDLGDNRETEVDEKAKPEAKVQGNDQKGCTAHPESG